MSPRRALAWLVVATALCAVATTRAVAAPALPPATAITLEPGRHAYQLSSHVEYLEDRDHALRLDQLVAGAAADRWFRSNKADPNVGFTRSAFWIRLRIDNPTAERHPLVLTFLYPPLDHADVHIQRRDGSFGHEVVGDRYPFASRSLPYSQLGVLVDTEPGQQQWIYLRVESESSVQLGLALKDYAGFVDTSTRDQLLHGLYYGIMLVMALYNLFLYAAVRNRAYLFYVVFVVLFSGTQAALDGTSTRYFFGAWPSLANTFTPFIIGVAQMAATLFTQSFLQTRRLAPRLYKFLYGFLAFQSLGVPLSLFASYSVSVRFVAATSLVTAIICEIAGVMIWRRGFRPARFYVLAWTSLIIGSIMAPLISFGLLPANAFTVNAQRVGSALEVALLSFALGDLIKLIEREKEQAKAEAMAMERDLALTGAVQQLFLPKQEDYREGDLALVGVYRPATKCGGDWWWYERMGTRLLVLVGDVTGHGAGAAMMTAAVAAAYRGLGSDRGPDAVVGRVRALDDSFRAIAGGMHHMSLAALEIDPARRQLRLVSAGAPAVFVLHASGSVSPLIAPGSLIGEDELDLGDLTFDLTAGDRIFVFSDGLLDLPRPNGRPLGYKGVERMLAETRGRDLRQARDDLAAALDRGGGASHLIDDVTFVLIDVRGGPVAS